MTSTEPWSDVPAATRSETLWIFDADFEDETSPDNLGWFAADMSGSLAFENHWHKDTIRIDGFTYLGDSTWWCGKYDDCWRQPRGYGNNWLQKLSRGFPLATWSSSGDTVSFEWDQRYAMEKDYDYGYVDVSDDGGLTWVTLETFTNTGFMETPGYPVDWDHAEYGHPVLDLSNYAGSDVRLRFRFESDGAYSSEDMWDNSYHTCLDGAWQLDNLEWKVNGTTVWIDDVEAPGDNGWIHSDFPGAGQTGLTWYRAVDPPLPSPGPSWAGAGMLVAIDPITRSLVEGEEATFCSPPIPVKGASDVVVEWFICSSFPGAGPEAEFFAYHGFVADTACASWCGPAPSDFESGTPDTRWARIYGNHTVYGDYLLLGGLERSLGPAIPGLTGVYVDRVRVGAVIETSVPDGGEEALPGFLSAHPNPFSSQADLTFTLAESGRVDVLVYDVAGRVVRTLVGGSLNAGRHDVRWDGTTDTGAPVASGVYFAVLDGPGVRHASKLVLMR
jgi:hypothetical protein